MGTVDHLSRATEVSGSSLATVVARLHAALQATADQHPSLVAAGLSSEQWRALDHLARRGPVTMSELASATGLTGPTATRVADALTQSSLAFRQVDPADRRRTVLQISKRGARLQTRIAPTLGAQFVDTAAQVLGRLETDQHDVLQSILAAATPATDG